MYFVVTQDHPYAEVFELTVYTLYFILTNIFDCLQELLKRKEFQFGVKDDSFRFCFTGDKLELSGFPDVGELQGWEVALTRGGPAVVSIL